ncbi:MAG: sulfatase family protein [Akkermansiaceae bacterium]
MKITTLITTATISSLAWSSAIAQDNPPSSKPNFIFILADDMGVGDVSHNGGKAPTPFIDQLAAEGMRFTDAHTSSAVCTPTRYSCLTGRYNWRTRLKRSVFFNPHDKPLIESDESTLGTILQDQGYHTACIGKWHLGIGWQFLKDFKLPEDKKGEQGWDIDYSKPAVTPTSVGFDYFWGIQASLDMAPYVYIKNEMATKPGTVTKAFFRKGAAAADFEANQCLRDFAAQSVNYINERAKEDKPFFLYLPLTSPHTPIVPSEKWAGKSGIGQYGDFLMETDWVVGEVLQALEKNNLSQNTIVLFTTDNGCSPQAKIPNLAKHDHIPSGIYRGTKADIYEGGHRVPFIIRWPNNIKPATVTNRLTCQTDVFSTIAEITGHHMKPSDGVDSVSFLTTLKNPSETKRDAIVSHSFLGAFAIRQGDWKLCLCKGSGGWSAPQPGKAPADAPPMQLYNLATDPGEKNNLYAQSPDKVAELKALLEQYVANGRSTPGDKQPLIGKTDIGPRE